MGQIVDLPADGDEENFLTNGEQDLGDPVTPERGITRRLVSHQTRSTMRDGGLCKVVAHKSMPFSSKTQVPISVR